MIESTITKYTLIEAIKRKLPLLFLIALVISITLSVYAASLAVLEKPQTLAAFYGFCIRLSAVGLMAVYLILAETRALDSAVAPVYMGLPLSRLSYLLGRLSGYGLLAVLAAALASAPLGFLPVSAWTLVLWGTTLLCELLLVILAAQLLAVVFWQPASGLFAFAAFYLFARASGGFERHSRVLLDSDPGPTVQWLAWIVKLSADLVPRLEEFAAAAWLLRDDRPEGIVLRVGLQTLVYGTLLFMLALARIRRRVF